MLARNITIPHRFVVFTDNINAALDKDIEPYPLWKEHRHLGHQSWRQEFPQCYVRLKAFSRDETLREILGPRYVSIDLDCVVVGNLDGILSRTEDFLIYRYPIARTVDRLQPYNGSMWMMDFGARPQVWEDFKGTNSLKRFENPEMQHFLQTDQGWLAYKLGVDEKGWSDKDGIHSRSWLEHKRQALPENARIVFFNGKLKPWDYLWIGENYK